MLSITYDELVQRTLGRITANVDKTEGSIIYDAIIPCVAELYEAYLYIEELENRVFADTSYGEYLDRRCAERGIYRKEAVFAIRKATFNVDVPIGSRWAKEELVYTVTEKVQDGLFKVKCNQSGSIGNRYSGELINMDAIENINSAILGEVVIAGSDIEEDEQLRKRYFDSFEKEAFGGNIKDYQDKVGAIEGVGQVKVYPVWNGGGTVKLLLLNSENNVPDELLIQEVQSKIDPIQNAGEGLGLAPIGHVVTVEAAKKVDVQVKFTLTFNDTTWEQVSGQVKEVIENYFNDLRSKWSDADVVVRISQIESRILDVEGIIDIQNTTLNAGTSNLYLSDDEVPNLLGVTNE